MRKKVALTFILAAVFIMNAYLCDAEKIYCKDGRVFQGKVASHDKRSIWIEKEAGKVGFLLQDITRIESDDGSISKYDYNTLCDKSQEYLKQKRFDEALALYSLLLESFPDNIQIHYLHGILSHKTGRIDEAADDYDFLIRHNAADGKIFNNLGAIYAMRGDYQEARRYFDKAAKERPDMPEAHKNLAEVLMRAKDYSGAIYEYNRVVEFDPRDTKALYNLGIAYMNTNNYAKAKEQWEKVLAISPDDDDTRSALKHIEEKLSKN